MPYEENRATWDKRFKQRHYSYRDFHREVPVVGSSSSDYSSYTFGTNARAVNTRNWPRSTDWATARNCYAREVKIVCETQDCWFRFVSLNPRYLTMLNQEYTADEIVSSGITEYITEVWQYLNSEDEITFYLTYGYSIDFYYQVSGANIYIYIEGNCEGSE